MSKMKDFLFLLIAFVLPMNKALVPLLIALMLFCWILEGDFKNKFSHLNKFGFGSISSLYFLLLLGLLYTENKASGSFDVEQKLSLLIFPLLIFSACNINGQSVLSIQRNFVWGSFISLTLCLLNAALHSYYSYNFDSFLYSDFSVIMHPSYYSMYLCLACVFVLFRKDILSRTFYKIPAALFLSFGVLLCSSKSGILTLVLVFGFKVLHKLFVKKDVRSSLVIIGILAFSFASLLAFFPKSLSRLTNMTETLQSQSTELNTTSSRIVIWKHSVDAIKQKAMLGYGTGDVNDVLQSMYKGEKESEIREKKLNAHNQFLQTTLALGLVGLVFLLLPYLLLIKQSLKKWDYIPLIFVFIILFNLLFESMYETQAGIVFIAFFLSLFLKNSKE
jgi:O-antigen ligase